MTSAGGRVLVVGGSGFIGSHLCAGLRTKGFEVVVLDRVPQARVDVEFHQGDVTDLAGSLSGLLEDVRAVYHLAWTTKPQSASDAPLDDLNTNVLAGIRLLDRIVASGARPRIIFASSGGAVYGNTMEETISEDHPTLPLNAYGVSKLAFEHYLRLYRHLHDLDYVTFRPSNPYGEFQDPHGTQGAVAVFLGRLARDQEITVWGDGSVVRDYLYVGDLVTALISAIGYVPGDDDPRVFNAGRGKGICLRELISMMAPITGRTPRVVYSAPRKTDPPRTVLDIRRISHHLSWKPTTTMDAGLTRTWNWIRESL